MRYVVAKCINHKLSAKTYQSAEGAGGMGTIRGNKVGESE